MWVQSVQVVPALWRAHWCRLSRVQDLPEVALVLWSCVPSFCPLSCFVLGALPANMALFRVLRAFLGGFMGFVWVCVVLVLCVVCVALYACGVRRIKGLWRVCSCFSSFAYLLLPFVLSLCSCFLSFVLPFVSLLLLSLCLCCSLWVCCWCCFFPIG